MYFFGAMVVQVPFVIIGQYLTSKSKQHAEKEKSSDQNQVKEKEQETKSSGLRSSESVKELERKLSELKKEIERRFKSRRTKQLLQRLGNISMWLSLFAGQPLLALLYFHDWYSYESMICDVGNSKYGFEFYFDRWSNSFLSNQTATNIRTILHPDHQLVNGEWLVILQQLFDQIASYVSASM